MTEERQPRLICFLIFQIVDDQSNSDGYICRSGLEAIDEARSGGNEVADGNSNSYCEDDPKSQEAIQE